VFGTMFKAWGVMLLRHGHYHSDPHPGNFMLAKVGLYKLHSVDQYRSKAPGSDS
jgi:predicted unusual protein kinase regulating ubiquinone biosynthesis (AarF/ABC1/UbiB family)